MEGEAGVGQTNVFKEGLVPYAMGPGDSVGQVLESLRNDSEGASFTPGLWFCSGLEASVQIWSVSRTSISVLSRTGPLEISPRL